MSELDPQWLFNGLFSIVGCLGGWLLNNIRDVVKELKKKDETLETKMQRIEVAIAGNYVRREDLDKVAAEIGQKLDRIDQKLDRKADK